MSRRSRANLIELAAPLETRIRKQLDEHLKHLGYSRNEDGSLRIDSDGKDAIRALHRQQRSDKLAANASFVKERSESLIEFFASGEDVDPLRIKPRIELVLANTWKSDLFRLATLLWAVPVSQGYGRRMRFLVWDDHNSKLIGLIGLGDPPFNLAVRDEVIGWSSLERERRLVNVMDAFILGAVPPYNQILGGKLVAALVRTSEVANVFRQRYGSSIGLISGKRKRAHLVAVTTTSALGRSAVYNRLKLKGQTYFQRIGWTGGWGHFHVPKALFDDMKRYLALHGHDYPRSYEFGDGPNWRLRTIRAALDLMQVDPDLLRHGVKREVFITWLADNALEVLKGHDRRADYANLLSVDQVAALALDRWVIPRAERDSGFSSWNRNELSRSWVVDNLQAEAYAVPVDG